MSGPLGQVKVLDMSRILAGPWAAQILGDLGADVIKVERPGVGDDTRTWGPPYLKDTSGSETHESAYYLAVNRSKRSITVDMKQKAGQDIIRSLAKGSDVVIENYKVGTLATLGLGYEDMRRINPRLVYCSITGFGQTGPKKQLAAYDFAIQALGGLMSVTGERDNVPGGGPQKVGVPIVDLMTGNYAAIAILAALAGRSVSGVGEYLDIAMLDVQVGMLANQAMNYLISGIVPRRTGNSHPNIQPQDVYECSDGQIAIAVGNDAQFEKFCEVLGLPELSADDRFTRNSARVRHLGELKPVIAGVLATRSRAAWVECFEAAMIPCGPIHSIDEVFEDEQVKERGMRVEVAHPLSGLLPQVLSPMRFTNSPLQFERRPPLLGEHTEEILYELGMDESEIGELRDSGVI
jgi:crotonobetainyl-CoA:carnitine CoA-transferase CaiB-like acyl-CoA transferase